MQSLLFTAFVALIAGTLAQQGPVCLPEYYMAVSQNTPIGTNIVQVVAQAPAQSRIDYSIPDTTYDLFAIDRMSGHIRVAKSLTGKTTHRALIAFPVRATDRNNLFCESRVEVNIVQGDLPGANSVPAFYPRDYTFSTTACQPGSLVGQVVALTSNLPLTYSLEYTNSFTIDSKGTIYVSQTITGGQTFRVLARDSKNQVGVATITVQANCQSPSSQPGPVFAQPLYQFQSAACAAGAYVGSVSATSSNGQQQQQISYNLNTQDFSIDFTGAIRVMNPQFQIHYFTVTARDNLNREAETTIFVTPCLQGMPIFQTSGSQPNVYQFTVNDCTARDVLIGRVTANGNGLRYSLSSSDFSIDSRTGDIRANKPIGQITGRRIVVEAYNFYGIARALVTVASACSNGDSTSCGGNPYILAEVAEEQNAGTLVTTLNDQRMTSFQIVSGNQALFRINQNRLETANNRIDRESMNTDFFVLRIQGRDNTGLTCLTDVHVTITDVNDNMPRFASNGSPYYFYSCSPVAGLPSTYSVGRVEATDPDEGDNKLVRYRIESGSGTYSGITIGPLSGEIRATGNSNGNTNWNFRVIAENLYEPSAYDVVQVQVNCFMSKTDKNAQIHLDNETLLKH